MVDQLYSWPMTWPPTASFYDGHDYDHHSMTTGLVFIAGQLPNLLPPRVESPDTTIKHNTYLSGR